MFHSKMVLAGVAALGLSACAGPQIYQGPLTGAFETPPTTSRGVGTVVATIYPTTYAMTYTVNYKDLTGPATAAHFHGPAGPGVAAPVIIPAVVGPTITGGATLTPDQLAMFQAGQVYFNIHTATFPGGEIRGQLLRAQ